MKKTRKKNLFSANNSMSMTPELAELITAQSAYVMKKTDEFIINLLGKGIHPVAIETVMGKAWTTLIKARCRGDITNTADEALVCLRKMIIAMTIAELQSDENK